MQRKAAGFFGLMCAGAGSIGFRMEQAPTLRGVVSNVLVIDEKEDPTDFGRPGGANIAWNEDGISPTLRREEHGHQPVVVLKENDVSRSNNALRRGRKEEL